MARKIPIFKWRTLVRMREKAQDGDKDRRERKRQKNNSRESLCNEAAAAAVWKPAYVSVLFWTHNIECHLFLSAPKQKQGHPCKCDLLESREYGPSFY